MQSSKKKNSKVIVEKTCANSLRVPFVNEIIPDAKFIYIKRDMLDVVGSAKHRWKAPINLIYLLKKAQFVPIFDLPYYASKFILSRIHRFFSNEKELLSGAFHREHALLLKKYSLIEICALQWSRCVKIQKEILKT